MMSVPPVEPPCRKQMAMPMPAMMPPRMTSRMRSLTGSSAKSVCPAGVTAASSGCSTDIVTESMAMQKMVFMPKFHPTIVPPMSSSTPLTMSVNMPMGSPVIW